MQNPHNPDSRPVYAQFPASAPKPALDLEAVGSELEQTYAEASAPGHSLPAELLDTVLALMLRHRLRIDYKHVRSAVRAAAREESRACIAACLALFAEQPRIPRPQDTNSPQEPAS